MRVVRAIPLVGTLLAVWLLVAAPPLLGAALSASHHKRLAEVHALIEQERWDAARGALAALRVDVGERPYARALLLQAEGWLNVGSGQPDAAIIALKAALARPELPWTARQDSRALLAELLLRQGDATAAAQVMEDWLNATRRPSAEGLYLAGTAQALAGNRERAIGYLERAVAGAKRVPEPWRQRLLALRLEAGEAEQARRLLLRMIATKPRDKTYWLQLADAEARLGRPGHAVAVLDLADGYGLLTQPAERLDLAGRWLRLGAPERAARLLQSDLDGGRLGATSGAWEITADAWRQAGDMEQAFAALERSIAAETRQTAPTPTEQTRAAERRLALAELAIECEDWGKALAAIEEALASGALRRPGLAHLRAGMAHHHRGEEAAALAAFTRAAGFDDARADANRWMLLLAPAKPATELSPVPTPPEREP